MKTIDIASASFEPFYVSFEDKNDRPYQSRSMLDIHTKRSKKFLSVSLLLLPLLFICGSCTKDKLTSSTPKPATGGTSNNGEVHGKIAMPGSSQVIPTQLTVLSSVNQSAVSEDGTFNLSMGGQADNGVIFLNDQDDKTLLMGYVDKGMEVVINTESTAIALLMLNPIVSFLQNTDRPKAIDVFKHHPQFPELKRVIEQSVINRRELLDPDNLALIEALEAIWANPDNARISNPDENAIPSVSLSGNDLITISNNKWALTYVAGIYNERNEKIETLYIGGSELKETSAYAWFQSPFIEGTESFVVKPAAPVQYKLTENGQYTIKMRSGIQLQYDSGIGEEVEALFINALRFFQHTTKAFNVKFFNEKDCLTKVLTTKANLLKEAIALGKKTSQRQLYINLVRFFFNAVVNDNINVLSACIDAKEQGFFIKYAKKILDYMNVFERGGALANAGFVGYSWYKHTSAFNYCVRKSETSLDFCDEEPMVPTEPIASNGQMILQVGTESQQTTTFNLGDLKLSPSYGDNFLMTGFFVEAKDTSVMTINIYLKSFDSLRTNANYTNRDTLLQNKVVTMIYHGKYNGRKVTVGGENYSIYFSELKNNSTASGNFSLLAEDPLNNNEKIPIKGQFKDIKYK